MSAPVTVTISGKEYQIACPEEEKPALIASAQMLNDNMEKIRSTGKVVGLDRIAVMAALNIANELIKLQNLEKHDATHTTEKIVKMKEKVNAFLDEVRQLDL
ncbi:MAG: cell division protein ZapA [Gammaproteobacteria bacterium]|nr:cell division protein ZapA [Gammaproteobacteria bacterium]